MEVYSIDVSVTSFLYALAKKFDTEGAAPRPQEGEEHPAQRRHHNGRQHQRRARHAAPLQLERKGHLGI